jgi:DNA-directed RNA polymerase subunit RPC12/RpoP
MIGFAMLFFWGHWWPGILILMGGMFLVESIFAATMPPRPQEPPPPAPIYTPPAPAWQPRPIPVQMETVHREDLLPATCPNCGGPVRAHDVKWTGKQSAACVYCGSNLPMKKQ